jgi:leader peptidase (prepilin peptidase)/N-methyltransferase
MAEAWLWTLGQGVLGAVFGSYIATVAVRWPEPARGRSACDGCGRGLRWWELVPLASYLALRGRCARCGAAIAGFHPICEVLGVAVGLGAAMIAPGPTGFSGAVFGWLLLALGAVDVAVFRLPNLLNAALAAAGITTALLLEQPLTERLVGGLAGFSVLWLAAALYRRARGRQGLGGGDAKLLGAVGLWLGWRALPSVLLIACAVGLVLALALRMKRDGRLPFGALLGAASFAIWCAQA